MKAIIIIKSEHQNLVAVLYSLEMLIEQIENGKKPDFTVFHGLLTYIDRFLDRYHHPRENDYLFPRLMERAPETTDLVKKLGRQHREGEEMIVAMLKALSAYEFCGDSEFPGFRETVLDYTRFEREHVLIEERDILPRAREALEASDWEEIDAAFSENQDPMFGEKWNNEFSDLLNKLINTLPAPLGLGDVWK